MDAGNFDEPVVKMFRDCGTKRWRPGCFDYMRLVIEQEKSGRQA
jgi:hypothetical protein